MPRSRRTAGRSPRLGLYSGLGVVALVSIAWVLLAALVLGIPAGLWQNPELAALRMEVLGDLGLEPPPATTAPASVPAPLAIEAFFTTPTYPERAEDRRGGIDSHLVALIDGARLSVDVAAYELDLDTVADALLRAHERGVPVRLVTDTDNLDEAAVLRLRENGIPVVGDGRGAIMHNKFVVIDGRYVWTGSWNLTVNCTYRNNNNALRIDSPALARNYAAEFEEMFSQRRFGPRSPADTPAPRVDVQGILVENYFAPEDQVMAHVVAAVLQARRSVRFMAFSFTSDELAQAMIQRVQAGVPISGVMERRGSDSEFSEYAPLRQADIDVLLDGNPYVMHHKVIVIDEEVVITGSFNFSSNADKDNDENLLIIHDPSLARTYLDEFARVRQRAAEAHP
ncbi:MAG: phospholipase D-like domain-containing protein [Anaerolineae bacterium]